MGRFCFYGGGRGIRTLGVLLMAAGFLILLLSLPGWMWASLVGVALISIGFLLWRFC